MPIRGVVLHWFIRSEAGATLVEYGVAMILAIGVGGAALVTLSEQTGSNLSTACTVLPAGGVVSGNC